MTPPTKPGLPLPVLAWMAFAALVWLVAITLLLVRA